MNGIAEVSGNYPSSGGAGERGAWFRDSEGNLLALASRSAVVKRRDPLPDLNAPAPWIVQNGCAGGG
jgi:hypothetical protein